jgi:hypothetical protein
MERLTKRMGYGVAPNIDLSSKSEVNDWIRECANRLAEYEDLEVAPEQIREIDKLYAEKCRELEALKKNHGFPCGVGDSVYIIRTLCDGKESKEICSFKVCAILISERGVFIQNEWRHSVNVESVFLTREDAEAKLAEMEGGHE